jgi:protein-S-isoprenylcysteine O-methyltransferase Ste14
VRYGTPQHARGGLVASERDVRLVRWQHRVFYALLVASPLEWWWRGRPAGLGQLVGALVFLAGVVGYRVAGGALGLQLSPLVAPREPARLVVHGPYASLRHPMYAAELAMAAGAPWTLGAKLSALLALLFAAVLLHRLRVEEHALAERLPEYAEYARRTYRVIPYVY